MRSTMMKECVDIIDRRAKVEASGNMTIKRIRKSSANWR